MKKITYTFTEDEWYEIEGLLNDAIFANRKRLQHAQGKIDLNVKDHDPRNGVCEYTEAEAEEAVTLACKWYRKFSDIRDLETEVCVSVVELDPEEDSSY